MPTPETTTKPRKARPKPELSIFEDELIIPFNKSEFLPDLPPHARLAQIEAATEPKNSPAPPVAANRQAPAPVLPEVASEPEVAAMSVQVKETWAKLEPILSQSGAKLEPNLSQSEAKVEPLVVAQPKLSTKLSQEPPTKEKKVEPELRPQVEPNLSQSEAKVEPNQPLSALVGLQRNVLLYVYESCRAEGAKTSAPISIENLASGSKTTTSAARKAAQRIEQKGYITRAQYKDGRGGWTRYAIPDSVYNALLLHETRAKVEPNLSQTRAKVEPEPEPKLRPSSPSSSSVLDLENSKTTTTGEPKFFYDAPAQLSGAWAEVDLTPLADVGFGPAHLVQLARHGKLTPDEVQDSIHHFAFDLKQNGKGQNLKGPPISFFMGILRKGVPYAPPENFESPVEAARRLYVESKRRIEERRQAEERELMELEFAEWRRGLSSEQLGTLVPEVVRHIASARESSLRSHFNEAVWPEVRGGVPGFSKNEQAEISHQIEQSLKRGQV